MKRESALFTFIDPIKHAVVGSDKELSGALNNDGPARGSYGWIHNRDMNRAGGKVFVYGEQVERGSSNILRWNFVCDINDACLGVDREYHPLHRTNEVILRAKISQESDDWHDGHSTQREDVTKL